VEMRLPPATGARLIEYLEAYRARDVGKIYGGAQRPRAGEGAGCSAFAVSFVELAGLLTDELAARWSHTVRIPEPLLGGTLGGRRVGLERLLLGAHGARWAEPDEPHRTLTIFDPERIHDWIGEQVANGAPSVVRGRSRGLCIDATSSATPGDPIWQAPTAQGPHYGWTRRA
jgi:hypothetical protein